MQIEKGKTAEYINEFKILKSLGSGYSAEVYLVADTDNHHYALKKYKPETSTLDTLTDELKVMKEFEHMNLIKLVSVLKDAIYKRSDGESFKCYAIVLEYAEGGELFDYIADTGKFSEKVSRTYFHQLLNGLNYMHNKGYAHRDIKPQNLLLSSDFTLKIADFGFSCRLRGHDGSGVLHTRLGTQGYMAPQIENKEYEGKYTDIFAAGVILFIMFSGNPPFENSSSSDPYYRLIRQRRFDLFWHSHSRKKTPNFYPETFKDLFQKLVAYIPHDRPMITEIAKHPWIKAGTICSHAEIISEFSERKKKLEQILEKKRKQQEIERARRKEVIHNQGHTNRDNEEVQDKEFMQIYNKELLTSRKLQYFEQEQAGDFVIKGQDPAYIMSELKLFLGKHEVSLAEDDNQEIINEEEELDKLIFKQIQDNNSTIQVSYTYRFAIDNQIFTSLVSLSLQLGSSPYNQYLLRIRPLSGDLLLCKRAIADILRGCWA